MLTQPLSFVATSNAIKYCGASSIFIDIDCRHLGMSVSALEDFLNSSAEKRAGTCINRISKKKISACVPMHTFGHPCEIDKLKMICDEWSIPLIEDAAESMGSFYRNKHTGTYGLLGTLSFNGNKIITAGGGGAILTNDTAIAKKAKHISRTAKLAHKWDFIHDQVGFNYRMPNLNAALLSAQLEKLDDFVARKRRLADDYKNWCAGANVNAVDNLGCTALHMASQFNNKSCIQLLLRAGVDVTAVNNKGHSALHTATQYNSMSCVQLLLAKNERMS